ncbi:hypothetical protein BH11PSE10_BH11PSE10_11880 [soil metagenome]
MLSPAQTRFKPSTQCPYCAHVSPDDSKFCNECGAALHLAPCPYCGAVNDVSLMDACARCNGNLHPTPETAPEEPDESQAPAASDEAAATAPAPEPARRLPAVKARPWPLLLGGMVLMVGASVAAYIAYQQRSAPSAKSIAIIEAVVREALEARPAAAPASSAERPAAARASEMTAAAFEPEAAPPQPRLRPPSKVVITRRPVEAAPGAPRKAVAPPPAKIGPCTEAVAALGLCSSGPDNNNRRP